MRRPKKGLGTPADRWLESGRDFLRFYLDDVACIPGSDVFNWPRLAELLGSDGLGAGQRWLLMSLVLWTHAHLLQGHARPLPDDGPTSTARALSHCEDAQGNV